MLSDYKKVEGKPDVSLGRKATGLARQTVSCSWRVAKGEDSRAITFFEDIFNIFGGYGDKRVRGQVDFNKTIVVKGVAIFGGGEIKSY